MPLADSLLDRSEYAARSMAPASIHDAAFIDPTGTWTDPAKLAKRDAWWTFIESNLKIETSKLLSRLRKRYSIPLEAPFPEVVLGWLTAKVDPLLYMKRGVDPSDQQYLDVVERAKAADEEIKEAADSETGLFDLPLRQDKQESGITQGGPFAYSEASPYDWMDRQREALS